MFRHVQIWVISELVIKIESCTLGDLKVGKDIKKWLRRHKWKGYEKSILTNWDDRKSKWIKKNPYGRPLKVIYLFI